MERICSPRSKFYSLRVDPFFEGFRHPEKQTGSYKSFCPKKNGEQSWRCMYPPEMVGFTIALSFYFVVTRLYIIKFGSQYLKVQTRHDNG